MRNSKDACSSSQRGQTLKPVGATYDRLLSTFIVPLLVLSAAAADAPPVYAQYGNMGFTDPTQDELMLTALNEPEDSPVTPERRDVAPPQSPWTIC